MCFQPNIFSCHPQRIVLTLLLVEDMVAAGCHGWPSWGYSRCEGTDKDTAARGVARTRTWWQWGIMDEGTARGGHKGAAAGGVTDEGMAGMAAWMRQ